MNIYQEYLGRHGPQYKIWPDGSVADDGRDWVLRKMGYEFPPYAGWVELGHRGSIVNVCPSRLHDGSNHLWIRPSETPGKFYVDVAVLTFGGRSKYYSSPDMEPKEGPERFSDILDDIKAMKGRLIETYPQETTVRDSLVRTGDSKLLLEGKFVERLRAFFANDDHLDLLKPVGD